MAHRFRSIARIGALVALSALLSGCIVVEPGHRHCGWFACR